MVFADGHKCTTFRFPPRPGRHVPKEAHDCSRHGSNYHGASVIGAFGSGIRNATNQITSPKIMAPTRGLRLSSKLDEIPVSKMD
jgi:hypothetical protein